ncbi:MAG: hypothetical protein ACFE8U_01110 [Candidatus Hermodarchaeota archaeon]
MRIRLHRILKLFDLQIRMGNEMLLERLKKRQRGQIRAVDFVVSLLLFLLMLSQLVLIIINVQSGIIYSEGVSLTYDELDLLGRSLLQEEGDPYWGYNRVLPNSFGLSADDSQHYLALDAAKISRIITGTSFSISSVSGFEMYDYDTLKSSLNLKTSLDFLLAIYPCIDLEVNVSTINATANNVELLVTNPHNIPISNAQAHFFVLDLFTGNIVQKYVFLTNNDGKINSDYQKPINEHMIFIIVEKGALWGMTWGTTDNDIIVGFPSNTTIWGGAINSTTLLVTDILELTGTLDSHYLSFIYKDTQSNYSNVTLDISGNSDGNESISVPNEGIVTFFSIASFNNVYRVGIGSFPAILDRDQTNGIFYQMFGKLIPSTRIKSMLSKTYPIIVRGTLMRCKITLWSE